MRVPPECGGLQRDRHPATPAWKNFAHNHADSIDLIIVPRFDNTKCRAGALVAGKALKNYG